MFDSIEDALEDLKNGRLIIAVDDEDRENEGDLIGITEWISSKEINFMARYGRGLICTPVSEALARRFHLLPMAQENTDEFKTAFTVSIDHKNTTTGISAEERYNTMRALINQKTESADFNRPGHVFPLIAKTGGVLTREGHTEAAVTLAGLTGSTECAVICEIMNDDGTMARVDDLVSYKKKHGLKMITIKALKAYVIRRSVTYENTVNMPTDYGMFKMHAFTDTRGYEHLAMVHGELKPHMNVRIHSECLTGDVFKSRRCDCGEQLDAAMKKAAASDGIILYMRQEGRGIGLKNKLKAYKLIEAGFDTVTANEHLGFDADLRTYNEAAAMLGHLGVSSVTLLSNNPKKISGLESAGIKVNREKHSVKANEDNAHYLKTKKEKLGHLI